MQGRDVCVLIMEMTRGIEFMGGGGDAQLEMHLPPAVL